MLVIRKIKLFLLSFRVNYYYSIYSKSLGNNHAAYEELQKAIKRHKKVLTA